MCASSCPDVLLIILSILFPPFGALARRGCGADFLINCGLTALGYLPGLIHAWYLICKYPVDDYEMLVDEYPSQGNHHHVVIIGHAPVAPQFGSTAAASGSASDQTPPPPPYQPAQKTQAGPQ
ncbi:plasma membrane proteolipid Pmp3 [Coemansia thaxteri]|uniref:Plasma membrane proteolipid Pmp3 n=1 Tax=Coemansia thaxteri TaxID=2663907 RepID=A0A9W8ECC8_9FUNG|nr:plasma membrane proteolipid Pmp3 [Coemansia thaxteri]KAJ2009767.1 plasma membrane proteolipid Pmp3 [Coemansia thaxteri]KAJ2474406.1 plasma membrane proteolipid Pmp3 [Coemansia sp. RSA 2322]KAJ2479703.1 plasma membrane proteolipid Pmp3 [Coemansia sp. RSA 2320]